MTTYEKLHSRIVELVPEIVELKFGCGVEYKNYPARGEVIYVQQDEVYTNMDVTTPKKAHLFKIIGRPITLEDVLMAIGEFSKNNNIDVGKLLEVRSDMPYQAMALVAAIVEKWHLGKPLEQQDEETLLFIGKILEI